MMSSVPYVPPDTMKKVAATSGQSVSLAVRLVWGIARVGNWAGRDTVLNCLSRPPYQRSSLSHWRVWSEFAFRRIRIFFRDAREIRICTKYFLRQRFDPSLLQKFCEELLGENCRWTPKKTVSDRAGDSFSKEVHSSG